MLCFISLSATFSRGQAGQARHVSFFDRPSFQYWCQYLPHEVSRVNASGRQMVTSIECVARCRALRPPSRLSGVVWTGCTAMMTRPFFSYWNERPLDLCEISRIVTLFFSVSCITYIYIYMLDIVIRYITVNILVHKSLKACCQCPWDEHRSTQIDRWVDRIG